MGNHIRGIHYGETVLDSTYFQISKLIVFYQVNRGLIELPTRLRYESGGLNQSWKSQQDFGISCLHGIHLLDLG